MRPNTQIIPSQQTSLLPAASEMHTLLQMADAAVKSGLLPRQISTPSAALIVMLKARELGIPPLYGVSNIHVINGKPTASAELMRSLIYRDHGDDALRCDEATTERCTISYKRRGWQNRLTYTFTLGDAERAELTTGNNAQTWRAFGPAMLMARCTSAVARMSFPDSIGGMYTPEELGAVVTADAAGNIDVIEIPNVVPAHPVHAARPAEPEPTEGEWRETTPASQAETDAAFAALLGQPATDEERPTGKRAFAPTGPSGNPGLATQAQVRAIYAIGRDQRKLTEQEVDQFSQQVFGTSPAELTKKQASDLMNSLKAVDDVPPATPAPPVPAPTPAPTAAAEARTPGPMPAERRAAGLARYRELRANVAACVQLPPPQENWPDQALIASVARAEEWEANYLPVFQRAVKLRLEFSVPPPNSKVAEIGTAAEKLRQQIAAATPSGA